MLHPTYNIHKSYDENYQNGPMCDFEIPKRVKLKPIKLWGYEINSPIGVPAGPLLNSSYIKLYAALGFDLPVYKTVRTVERKAHLAPNCLMVKSNRQLTVDDIGNSIYPFDHEPQTTQEIAITNSFGIPSKSIEIWQADIEKANRFMADDQLMIVSCVGTPSENRNFIDDFVFCAQKAVEAGAKAIELNYSCPNVVSKEGSIYQDPVLSGAISKAVKKAIKDIPLMIKMGYIANEYQVLEILKANAPFIDGVSAINTISMQARNKDGSQALPGEGRLNSGICGSVIKNLALEMTKRIHKIRKQNKFDFVLCSVGGIVSLTDIDDYLQIGADIAMSATGAMWNPLLAYEWQHQKSQLHIRI
ncbi:dihydroorotate dehydrogenase [Fastidiosibacter lacustris]|uniref:dihydroorotate dehydrogenase n=1 Tax=Fastidiosibacter lacustris TaxID=2056695 RepID=UPI000E3436F2|nr:dihydroorotate dehydrogenase [Fastidiosibacter lacustris]